jgi:hypothetical protein
LGVGSVYLSAEHKRREHIKRLVEHACMGRANVTSIFVIFLD